MEIRFFNSKVEKFYQSFDGSVEWRIDRVFKLLASEGYMIGLPHSRALGKGLFELRIIGSVHIRFFYTFNRGCVYILHGFIKKTEQIPDEEIQYARMQLKNLL